MTETPVSREAFELGLQSSLEASRRERTSRFGPDTTAWLALPPPWTGRLARQAGFPGWDPAFLDAAANEGLCARTEASLADQPPWYAAEVGARLAAYLPATSQVGLLDEVAAIGDQHARARVLTTMTSALPATLLPQVARIADGLTDPVARTRALLGLAAAQPPGEAMVTARLALSVAEQVEDPGDRAETLLLVADQSRLDDGTDGSRQELGQAILATVPALGYESERGSVLGRAAPYLTPPQIWRALAMALDLQTAECRIEAIAGITRQLPDTEAVALLKDQIAAVSTIGTEIGRARAAKTLDRRLADYQAADPANSAALALADGSTVDTAPLAAALAPTAANARALVSLVTALVRKGLQAVTAGERALQSIASVSGADDRYQLYRRLLTALREPLRSRAVEQALAAARSIVSPADRVDALVDLAPQLPPAQLQAVIQEARSLVARETDFSFWMPEPARTEVLGELALQHGSTFLHEQIILIAKGVRRADRPDDPVSPSMARWAELANQGAFNPAQAAAWLDRRLAELTESGDTGQALAWVETGKLLVPVLGQELDSVVSVGLRRIELLYRRSLDLGHLRRFLPRQEQIDEFWRLLDSDGTVWAVHYLGVGGLGKTMLLRQVTARLAPGRGIAVARVDFDHLSPDYPIVKPGQLLLELFDELQSFAPSGHADSFAYSFRAQVNQLHAPLPQGSNDPLARIHDVQFDEVLRTFRDFVLLLPQPVVFILDTCEELANRRSEGSTLPPVQATFEILERLHQEIPGLRVIFAGRRLLARSGQGWAVSPAADAEGHALLPARKDYLALHEMRGFSRDEAVSYLSRAAPGLSAEMTAAILTRSPAPARAAPIVREPPRDRDGEYRYNPFDLNLYSSWAREDPSLRAETVAQGTTDPYVAIRIVRRLGRANLDRLLPAVTLLGRFDRSMLRGELAGSDEKFESAYYDLSSREWIDYQPDPSLNTTFLEVDRNLRPRLLSYYRSDPDRAFLLRGARDRLGPALARLVEDRPLDEIGVDLADAAMRLLSPAAAARLWDKVAGKIRAQCDWPWADQRTSRLLGENGAVADPGHPARAAVVAARISSLIHARSEYNPAPDWREVAERADASPDPAVQDWLRSRAVAGLVTAFRLPGVELSADDLAAFWELIDQFPVVAERLPAPLAEQLAASCCAALEALVEVAEMRTDPSLLSDIPLVERWLGYVSSLVPADLLALGTMIAARGQALHGRFTEALVLATQAERSSAELSASQPDRWADFDTPPVICHRIRLEFIRMATALPLSADPLRVAPVADWQRAAEADLGSIDTDRLLAAITLRRLAAGILPRDEVTWLAQLEERATQQVRRMPHSARWCHRAVPPLFTVMASCWCALGESDRAIELLHAKRRRALADDDADTENAALIATLEVSRRMRIGQPVLAKNSGHSADAGQRAAAWVLMALTEQAGSRAAGPAGEIPEASLHDWWRSRPAVPRPGSAETQGFRHRCGPLASARGGQPPFGAVSLGLDLVEADIAAAKDLTWPAVDLAALSGSGQVTAEQMLRLALRLAALGYPGPGLPGADRSDADLASRAARWKDGIGWRRKAELAQDEGELLALRLPREAVPVLDLAAAWFEQAGDPAGALFADISATLARLRAGIPLRPDGHQVFSGRYRAAADQTMPQLPGWDDLTREYLARPPRQLEQVMGGWLPRLVTCLARDKAKAGSAAALGPVRSGQVERMLQTTLGAIPTELDPSVLARRRARRRGAKRSRLRTWLTVASAGLALTILGAVTGALFPRLSVAFRIVVVLGELAILAAPVVGTYTVLARTRSRLATRARAWRWARSVAGLRITPSPGARVPDGDIRVVIERWQESPGYSPPWKRRAPAQVDLMAVLPPLRSYQRAAAALPDTLQAGLRELASRVGSRPVRISLDLGPAVERMPWEALLSYPVLAEDTARIGALDFWRRGEPLPGTGSPRRSPPPRRVAVLADSTRRLFAERAGLASSVSFPDASAGVGDVNRAIERAGAQASDPPDIVLVIGRPVRVRGAILLQTAEQAAARGTSADELHEAVVGAGLLEPQVVAGLQARLFIVLGAPTATGSRFDTERRDAADLRGWAADVFRAGAATVIMVPSLEPGLAEAILNVMASHIKDGITPGAVHEAVRAVRARIGTRTQSATPPGDLPEDSPAPAERAVEQALDVCLFRREWTPAFSTGKERT